MLPLLLLLASDPTPSLDAIVALGRGAPVGQRRTSVIAAGDDAAARPDDDALAPTPTAETAPAAATATVVEAPIASAAAKTPLVLTPAAEPSPWAGIALLIALGGGAFGLWWKKRGLPRGSRLLQLQESVAVGKGRALIVADVAGRRVLLGSSESGVSLLLDLGQVPATSHDVADDAFAHALAAEVKAVSVGITQNGDDGLPGEGHEIQRRIERARRAA